MNNNFLLKEDFSKWLIEISGISEASAESYLSYISGINKNVTYIKTETFFTYINDKFNEGDLYDIKNYVDTLSEKLAGSNASNLFGKSKKTLLNYRSALHSYMSFLEERIKSSILTIAATEDERFPEINNLSEQYNDSIYNKKELENKFLSRLKTQDRFYQEILYPIRFLFRVYRERGQRHRIHDIFTKQRNNIKIRLKEKSVKFSDIKELSIKKEHVFITMKSVNNGDEHIVYTRTSEGNAVKELVVNNIDKVSIEHEPSLHKTLTSNVEFLTVLNSISLELRKHIKGSVTYKKLCNVSTAIELTDFIANIDIEKLHKELEFIIQSSELELMDRVENTKKGKS